MPKHVNITISGKVQGVFFRASAKAKADALGVAGFVRNESNGNVYIEAEGDDVSLEEFVSWCQHGPDHARVALCDVQPGSMKHFRQFSIQR